MKCLSIRFPKFLCSPVVSISSSTYCCCFHHSFRAEGQSQEVHQVLDLGLEAIPAVHLEAQEPDCLAEEGTESQVASHQEEGKADHQACLEEVSHQDYQNWGETVEMEAFRDHQVLDASEYTIVEYGILTRYKSWRRSSTTTRHAERRRWHPRSTCIFILARPAACNSQRPIPGKPGKGGGNPPGPGGCCSIGFAWPSAAYELVIESITDCAFSWPISVVKLDAD